MTANEQRMMDELVTAVSATVPVAVAKHYSQLMAEGLPGQVASALTVNYQMMLLSVAGGDEMNGYFGGVDGDDDINEQ